MNRPTQWVSSLTSLAARAVLGSVLVYAGLGKALLPADFLRVIADYNLTLAPEIARAIAALLPWFEVFCGLLLIAGIALRGTALLTTLMILVFSGLILVRSLHLAERAGIAFCAVAFDCGCGLAVTPVCPKLAENFGLLLLSVYLLRGQSAFACLRHQLFPVRQGG